MGRGTSHGIRIAPPERGLSGVEAAETTDRAIAGLAVGRRGLVARREMLAAGIAPGAIDRRLKRGILFRVHPGVFAVGHPGLDASQALLAAQLYGGERSILSCRGAAQAYELAHFVEIDLIVPTDRSRRGRLVFHRGSVPDGEWLEREDGLRLTTPSRTILDLCRVLPTPRLRRIYQEAEVRGLIDAASIRRVLGRHRGRHGVARLREVAGLTTRGEGRIRSHLEARFRRFLADFGLPPGERNVRLAVGDETYEVDHLWRAERIVVELDGRRFHDTQLRFEADRERDRRLAAHGWRPVRVTDRHLDRPRELKADLDLLLGGPAASSG